MLGMNFPKLFQRDVSSYVCGILYLDPSASLKRIFAFPVGGLFRPSTCPSTCSRSLFFTAAHFQLALVAASICHFVTAATKFSCCSVPTKNVPFVFLFVCLFFFFISRSRSLSPFFSLSFAGLSPTFSFSPSFSCSIFQICGHEN